MKKLIVVLISVLVIPVYGQQIQVPNNVTFADIQLTIDASAREKIQKNVDALLKYPTYFQQKVERAETYFPIIERVFREVGLPEDFKYLAIQESGLVSDAVSSSKAEGFWQFKKETALDFGLAVNPNIDERRHIIEASRGAAKYMVQSNAYYKNWANTMVSYYMGFTGAKAYARPADAGSKNMLVTDQTHIYFITFLAHKIAFENFIGKNPKPAVTLREMRANPGQSLGEIALATQTDPVELEKYNRWLLGSSIPQDKDYTVLIPVTSATPVLASTSQDLTEPVIINKKLTLENEAPTFTKVNGLKAIVAKAGDTKDKLALQAKISTKKFLKLNDMYSFDPIVAGQVYYLEKKFTSGRSEYHVAQPGESLFSVAQQHGIRLKSLLSKNRMKKNEALVAGRVLWLQQTRPANIAVEYRRVETPTVPKTPQPLTAQFPVEAQPTDSRKDETVLSSIKESASGAFQKAGAALNVPEKQPEVAKVGGDVFEETIELNPEVKKETTPTKPAPITEENLAGINEVTEPVTEKATVPATKTEEAQTALTETSDNINTEASPKKIAGTTPETEENTTEKPAALYPKTVAKTEQKVELKEPTQPETSETVKTETVAKTAEKVAVNVSEKPAVILKEPVTAPAPKTVTVADKKPVKVTEEPAKPSTHKVAKGETLYSISRKYGVSPSDLKYWNELGEKPLAIGQELKVTGEKQIAMPVLTVTGPDKPLAEGTVVTITHRVGEGESMYQISRKYGVSIKEIMEWNNKADFNVSAGDELMIRSRPGSSRN